MTGWLRPTSVPDEGHIGMTVVRSLLVSYVTDLPHHDLRFGEAQTRSEGRHRMVC